jgi:hypothetical protein
MLRKTEEGTMRTSRMVVGAIAAVACVVAWSPAWAQHEEAEKKAVEAATPWLALVDAGKNAESWDTAAAYFKWTVTKVKWDARLINFRVPLGPVVSRKLSRTKYMPNLADAPKGEYVLIEYKTAFDGMPKAIENLTMMLQQDGSWRVCGYNIKPLEKK